jgi:hypothetical protein
LHKTPIYNDLNPAYLLIMIKQEKSLHTLIPLEVFKVVMGIDDREDKIARFCIVTATLTIEQYCKRRLLRKKYFERIECIPSGRARVEGSYGGYSATSVNKGDIILPLREYPVSKVLAVYALTGTNGTGEIVEPDFYSVIPDCGTDYDLDHSQLYFSAICRTS